MGLAEGIVITFFKRYTGIMIDFNHALVGGLIGKYVPWPVAIPLALASHFMLDALPHYGIPSHERDRSWFWKIFFTCDALATFGLAAWAILYGHFAMFFGGLAGVIPDFLWVKSVIQHRSFTLHAVNNTFEKWHKKSSATNSPAASGLNSPSPPPFFILSLFVPVRPYCFHNQHCLCLPFLQLAVSIGAWQTHILLKQAALLPSRLQRQRVLLQFSA